MTKIILASSVLIIILLVAIGAYIAGSINQREKLGVQLEAAQAMLWFNHIQRYRDIESDLSKNCTIEALEKIRISIDKDMELLASFYKKHNNTWVNKYIADRDSELLGKLNSFNSKYGSSWSEPKCTK